MSLAVPWFELCGYFAILLMGFTLGLIGAGGSILTVPILVYLFGLSPTLATAYSLVLVGSTAAAGGVRHALRGDFDREAFLTFGLPSIVSVYLARRYVLPSIPQSLGTLGSYEVTRDGLIMLIFSAFMLGAALLMIRGGAAREGEDDEPRSFGLRLRVIAGLEGLVVGGVTGLVGAGGGFLIVPALVWLLKIPIRRAVSTSLLIIAAKSLIGFIGDLQGSRVIDWPFLLGLLLLSSGGILIGLKVGKKIPAAHLQRGFGWFVLITGVLIIGKEVIS